MTAVGTGSPSPGHCAGDGEHKFAVVFGQHKVIITETVTPIPPQNRRDPGQRWWQKGIAQHTGRRPSGRTTFSILVAESAGPQ